MTKETYYIVEFADFDYDSIMDNGAVVIAPSKEINIQSIEKHVFQSEKEALDWTTKYHKEYSKDLPEGKKWLAYVEVYKIEKTLIEKIK